MRPIGKITKSNLDLLRLNLKENNLRDFSGEFANFWSDGSMTIDDYCYFEQCCCTGSLHLVQSRNETTIENN